MTKEYYVYAYVRQDGSPYYIGKGKGKRAYQQDNHNCGRPKEDERIVFIEQNLTERQAFDCEKQMIMLLGRKDLGTGILRNLTDGGEGTSGARFKMPKSYSVSLSKRMKGVPKTEKQKRKIREGNLGKKRSAEAKANISKAKKGRPWTQARRDAEPKNRTWTQARRDAQLKPKPKQ